MMFFIPMNVHNELFDGVRQLRWQHLSPVVRLSCKMSIRLLSSLIFLWYPTPFSPLVVRFGDVDVFLFPDSKTSLAQWLQLALACQQWANEVYRLVYQTDVISVAIQSSLQLDTFTSDHCSIDTVAPSCDHYCIDIRYSSAI